MIAYDKVLLVDDDRDLADLLAFALRRAGLTPIVAYSAEEGRTRFDYEAPDLLVLDINLGQHSGLDFLREVRRRSETPVILLTARDTEDDKVAGLELGADDYLTKPFSHRELVARIRVQLRKQGRKWEPQALSGGPLAVGPLVLNPTDHALTVDGTPVHLTVTEFRLLHFLMSNAGTAVPTRTILKHVWGYTDAADTDLVRVTVFRLRRKIERDPRAPCFLHTVVGIGFLLKAA